jgi:preprotein translocase SecE subunit
LRGKTSVAENTKKTKKSKTSNSKPKTTMRESAAKSRAKASKPKRVRKAAETAAKPVGAFGRALKNEYHIFSRQGEGNFFTKSRRITPGYFRDSARELKNVTWPGRSETWRLVFAVFLFAILMGTAISVLDFGLEKLLREVIL